MIVIVDTNIVFSAILSPKGKINDILLNSDKEFEFFAPNFLIDELDIHHEKIKALTGYDDCKP